MVFTFVFHLFNTGKCIDLCKFATHPNIHPAIPLFGGRKKLSPIYSGGAERKLAPAQFEGLAVVATLISHMTVEWKTKWIFNISNLYLPIKNQIRPVCVVATVFGKDSIQPFSIFFL